MESGMIGFKPEVKKIPTDIVINKMREVESVIKDALVELTRKVEATYPEYTIRVFADRNGSVQIYGTHKTGNNKRIEFRFDSLAMELHQNM